MNVLIGVKRWARATLLALFALLSHAVLAAAPQSDAIVQRGREELLQGNKTWTGDFDGMLERRLIRFLVPYSRSLYFVDKGRER